MRKSKLLFKDIPYEESRSMRVQARLALVVSIFFFGLTLILSFLFLALRRGPHTATDDFISILLINLGLPGMIYWCTFLSYLSLKRPRLKIYEFHAEVVNFIFKRSYYYNFADDDFRIEFVEKSFSLRCVFYDDKGKKLFHYNYKSNYNSTHSQKMFMEKLQALNHSLKENPPSEKLSPSLENSLTDQLKISNTQKIRSFLKCRIISLSIGLFISLLFIGLEIKCLIDTFYLFGNDRTTLIILATLSIFILISIYLIIKSAKLLKMDDSELQENPYFKKYEKRR